MVRLSVPLSNTLLTMLHSQGFCTPIKHVTHYGPRSGFLYPYPTRYSLSSTVKLSVPYQTRYSLCSTVRLSVPLTNMLPTMVHGQAFCTSNKHGTHYAPRSGFLYPYQTRYSLCSTVRLSVPLTNMLLTMVHGQAFCTLTNTLPTMVHGQASRTSNKHVTHNSPRSGFPYL